MQILAPQQEFLKYMRPLFISIFGIFILAFIGFIFLKNVKKDQSPIVSGNTKGSQEEFENNNESNISSVNVLEKNVFHLRGSLKEEIFENKKVSAGDFLETSKTGRALIEDFYGSVTVLDYSSKYKILSLNENINKGFLESGKSWSKVKKILKEGQSYEVETNNAVAIVRGTSFGVFILKGTTYLFVTEGSVLFVPVDIETRERFYNRAVLVKSPNKAYIDKSGNVIFGPLTDLDIKDPWYIYNNNNDSVSSINNTGGSIRTNLNTSSSSNQNNTSSFGGGGGSASSGLSISSVIPNKAYSGDTIYLKGSGFSKLTSLIFGKYSVDISSIKIRDDSNLSFIVPDVVPAVYSISFLNNNNESFTKEVAIEILETPFVDTYNYQYGQ